jgi:hypothetical protein
MKTFKVRLYYSGFRTVTVEAENEDEALEKAREEPFDVYPSDDAATNEILTTLETWYDADTAEEV